MSTLPLLTQAESRMDRSMRFSVPQPFVKNRSLILKCFQDHDIHGIHRSPFLPSFLTRCTGAIDNFCTRCYAVLPLIFCFSHRNSRAASFSHPHHKNQRPLFPCKHPIFFQLPAAFAELLDSPVQKGVLQKGFSLGNIYRPFCSSGK